MYVQSPDISERYFQNHFPLPLFAMTTNERLELTTYQKGQIQGRKDAGQRISHISHEMEIPRSTINDFL